MKKIIVLLLLISCFKILAQDYYSINGHFPKFPNTSFDLKGTDGFQKITLSTAKSGEDGKFTLTFPKEYKGEAQLFMNGSYLTLFLLNKENITIYWEDLTKTEDIKLNGSSEYDAFLKGMKIFQDSEAKLAGLHYLMPLYEKDTIKQKWVTNEMQFVANSFPVYVKSLNDSLFTKHYLHTRGLITHMPKSVETYSWRAPMHVEEFMAIDFMKLKHSGLYKEVIEGYTNLVERFPLEEVYPLLNAAIDKVLSELKTEPTLQQELAQLWFSLLEQKSLYASAEHLALSMLNQENCVLDATSKNRFEQYRALALGKTAPNIVFKNKEKREKNIDLRTLGNNYKLLVFGASWCPNCQKDYTKLKEKYKTLKVKHDLEIVYISIDTDIKLFQDYYKEASFFKFCDGKGWETQAAKDYHVFATPTYILLDRELKILAKINSPEHLESWLLANRNQK